MLESNFILIQSLDVEILTFKVQQFYLIKNRCVERIYSAFNDPIYAILVSLDRSHSPLSNEYKTICIAYMYAKLSTVLSKFLILKLFNFIDVANFSNFFCKQMKSLTTVLYNYQHKENQSPINNPNEFVKMIEERDPSLKDFFNIIFQSMNPSSKNKQTVNYLKQKVMILCYQMASLRNKQVSFVKNSIALHLVNSGTSVSSINTMANLGFSSTYKTAAREKNKIAANHLKNFQEYFMIHVCKFNYIVILIL